MARRRTTWILVAVLAVGAIADPIALDFEDFFDLVEDEKTSAPNATTATEVAGGWGEWGEWGDCEGFCDEGTMTKSRHCDSPPPSSGGEPCAGESSRELECDVVASPCPDITIPFEIGVSCDEWIEAGALDVEYWYQRAIMSITGISKDSTEIRTTSCTKTAAAASHTGGGGARRRLLLEEDDDDSTVNIELLFDLQPTEVRALIESPSNPNGTAFSGLKELLLNQNEFEEKMNKEALNLGAQWPIAFVNTYKSIEHAFDKGLVADSTKAAVKPVDLGEEEAAEETRETEAEKTETSEVLGVGEEEEKYGDDTGSGGGSPVKAIVFLIFVVVLTTFVVCVLGFVSCLEHKKAEARKNYEELSS